MQRLRDNPDCAQEEYDRILDDGDPGLQRALTLRPARGHRGAVRRPRRPAARRDPARAGRERPGRDGGGVRPRRLRGGRCAHERHHRAARVRLADFKGFAACGGFSYGDVLGAGEGWAKSILFNARARDEFEAFFARTDTFALGVCNGCQMMATCASSSRARRLAAFRAQPLRAVRGALRDGGGDRVARRSCSPAWRAAACRSRSRTARAVRSSRRRGRGAGARRSSRCASSTTAARRPRSIRYNPNGSPGGITGLTTPDGRFTILMPHPERVFRTVQYSWRPGAGARTGRGCGCSATRGAGWARDVREVRPERKRNGGASPRFAD